MKRTIPGLLVFLSGLAGLVYQLLWMRQLGLLFSNTAGAATGVLCAAFLLIPRLGFTRTCVVAMLVTGTIAIAAFLLASRSRDADENARHEADAASSHNRAKRSQPAAEPLEDAPGAELGRKMIRFVAFVSGVSVLALEVQWTRMLAQVHENSVYSFAAVLVIVLVCLALGALAAGALAATRRRPRQLMSVLMVVVVATLALSPLMFTAATGGLNMLSTRGSFGQYVGRLLALGGVAIGPSCLVLGMVFPYLMKCEQRYADDPGRSIGYLSALNTVGAVLGALLCGFVLLRTLGMWWTVHGFAALYLLVGMVLPTGKSRQVSALRVTGVLFLLLQLTALNPTSLPVVGGDPLREPETVLETWETSDCTVSVGQDRQGHLSIKVNSNYTLGSTKAIPEQEFGSVTRTMLDVFDQVTLWRNNFTPGQEIAALHRAWLGYAMQDMITCSVAWDGFVTEWTNQWNCQEFDENE